MSIRMREWETKNGTSTVWVVSYRDRSGDRAQKQFKRKKDADDFHARNHVAILDGVHVSASKSPTVAEAGELWIARVTANGMKGDGPAEQSTIDQYRQHLDLHISPRIGTVKLGALSLPRVEQFRDSLLAGLSRATAGKVFTSFKSILKSAGCVHLVGNNAIRNKKRNKRRIEAGADFPTPAEVKRLMDALAPEDLRRSALLHTVAFTGLRASELRGLRWKDIDFKGKQLHVRQRADRYNKIGTPKTADSVRTVPVDDTTLEALRMWKLKSQHSKENDLVFATRTGKPKAQDKLLDELKGVMVKAKLTSIVEQDGKDVVLARYGLRSLRHFFASWCINEKAHGGRELPAKRVQEYMGHSSITQTMDTYGHLFPNKSDRAELDASVRGLLK
jgi:integrase